MPAAVTLPVPLSVPEKSPFDVRVSAPSTNHDTVSAIDFSGAPVLYPLFGALTDSIGGLSAARILSLIFMLGVTLLLIVLHGNFMTFNINALHELGHNTVFKTKALNLFFEKFFSFFSWMNCEMFF